jgi:hypothetical protein
LYWLFPSLFFKERGRPKDGVSWLLGHFPKMYKSGFVSKHLGMGWALKPIRVFVFEHPEAVVF